MNPLELIDPTIASLSDIDTDQVNEIANDLVREFAESYPYPALESQTADEVQTARHLEQQAMLNAALYAVTLSVSGIAPREIVSVSVSMYLLQRFRPVVFAEQVAKHLARREQEENFKRSLAATLAANGGEVTREQAEEFLAKFGVKPPAVADER